VKTFADIFLWAMTLGIPAIASTPFAFSARHRTVGKITTAIVAASWLEVLLGIAAVRLT
jgi:hypothetical protein